MLFGYFNQGLLSDCIRIGEELIASGEGKLHPNTGDRLARAYLNSGKPEAAERICRLILEKHPENAPAWCYLGDALRARKGWNEAEEAYRKALEFQPRNIAFTRLMQEYIGRREFEKAEELGREILARAPDDARLLGVLSHLYQIWAEHDLSQHVARNNPDSPLYDQIREKREMADYYYRGSAIRQGRAYRAETIDNYRKIAATLGERGIPLVAIQYPMRSVEPLRKILSDKKDLVFVDNRKIFRKAVEEDGFQNYFIDCFGGDFGHCTPAGNRLLARNIADTIQEEYFRIPGGR